LISKISEDEIIYVDEVELLAKLGELQFKQAIIIMDTGFFIIFNHLFQNI